MLSAIAWDVDTVAKTISKIKLNEARFAGFRSASSVPATFTESSDLRRSVHDNYGA
jgi:hypothetical protein